MPKWAPREALAALSVRLTRGVWYPFSGSAVPSRRRFPCPALSPGFSMCELHSTDKQTNKISLLLMAVVCFCNLWLLSSLIFYMSGSGKVKRCTEFTARLPVQSELLLQPCLLQLCGRDTGLFADSSHQTGWCLIMDRRPSKATSLSLGQ